MVTDPFLNAAIVNLGLVGVGGAVAALVARRVNQPTVVGFLVAGVLLGPVTGIVQAGALLEAFGSLGIALLLFLVGLDLSVEEARAVGAPVLVAGLVQMVVSGLGGFAVLWALGFDTATAGFLALALAFSSTVVVVKLLVDRGELAAPHGRLAVGILLLQDLIVVLALTILPVAAGGGAGSVPALAWATGSALVRTALLVGGGLLVASRVLPFVFRFAAGLTGLHLLLGLAWVFLLAAVALALEVSVEIAAFTAGLGLATTPYANALRRSVHPLLDLFIALFFVTLGVQFALGDALRFLPAALAFSAFVLVSKGILLTLVLGALGYATPTSLRAGLALGQVSEFAIVLGVLGVGLGVVGQDALNFILLVAMITIAASAAIAWNADAVVRRFEGSRLARALPGGTRAIGSMEEPFKDHVVILGWDALGARIARVLLARGEHVVIVDAHPDVPDALQDGVHGVYAETRTVLEVAAAHAQDAKLIVANVPEPGLVRILLESTKGSPAVIARAETAAVARILKAEGAAGVISEADVVADRIVSLLPISEVEPSG